MTYGTQISHALLEPITKIEMCHLWNILELETKSTFSYGLHGEGFSPEGNEDAVSGEGGERRTTGGTVGLEAQ